jgi:hypothetical protein
MPSRQSIDYCTKLTAELSEAQFVERFGTPVRKVNQIDRLKRGSLIWCSKDTRVALSIDDDSNTGWIRYVQILKLKGKKAVDGCLN